MLVNAQFPAQVWDGLSPNTWRKYVFQDLAPDHLDWSQITVEVIATQQKVKELEAACGGSSSRCRVYFTDGQSCPKVTLTKLNFDTVDYDGNSEWSVANHQWVCKETGYYLITANLNLMNYTGFAMLQIVKNNATVVSQFSGKNGQALYLNSLNVVHLNVGDALDVRVMNASLVDAITGSGASETYFCIAKV